MQELGTATVPDVASVKVRDGTEIAVAVYSPSGRGPFPALFAPSPYRFDNNVLPASPQFLWRETGPIDFYVEQGYAYVHMDVRGSGRSGGEFDFFGRLDQRDLYDVIEWIGGQPWSNGRVGGIGQSYYCNPGGEVVTRGWLRASHRALDPARSTEFEPYHTHAAPEPIVPGEVYRFDISLEPMAFRFRQGHRIRLEIVNGDSPVTEVLWTHYYRPDKISRDTIHHDARHPSALILPVTSG